MALSLSPAAGPVHQAAPPVSAQAPPQSSPANQTVTHIANASIWDGVSKGKSLAGRVVAKYAGALLCVVAISLICTLGLLECHTVHKGSRGNIGFIGWIPIITPKMDEVYAPKSLKFIARQISKVWNWAVGRNSTNPRTKTEICKLVCKMIGAGISAVALSVFFAVAAAIDLIRLVFKKLHDLPDALPLVDMFAGAGALALEG